MSALNKQISIAIRLFFKCINSIYLLLLLNFFVLSKSVFSAMNRKRQSVEKDDNTPQKVTRQESNFEYAMLMQKFKAMENQWKERGVALSKKQEEINVMNKKADQMRAGYDEKIKRLNELLAFKVGQRWKF